MTLSIDERKFFFSTWLGLLAFVNDKYRIDRKFGHPQSPVGLHPEAIISLKNKLWENVADIDEYIDSARFMPEETMQLLRGWKKGITGTFTILKHLKKYSVFLRDSEVYGVIGITNPISEIINGEILPATVKTTLIPFGERIIYDSIFNTYNVSIGPNMKRDFYDNYIAIKKERGIITQL